MKYAALMCSAFALAVSTPATAQNFPMDYGDYVEVTAVDVLPGGDIDYLNWLATQWKKNQEYAKQQGWITSYEVLGNLYPRQGEADIYLLVRMKSLPDAAESARRDEAYRAFMAKTDAQMSAESGDRGKFRKILSSELLGELRFRK